MVHYIVIFRKYCPLEEKTKAKKKVRIKPHRIKLVRINIVMITILNYSNDNIKM